MEDFINVLTAGLGLANSTAPGKYEEVANYPAYLAIEEHVVRMNCPKVPEETTALVMFKDAALLYMHSGDHLHIEGFVAHPTKSEGITSLPAYLESAGITVNNRIHRNSNIVYGTEATVVDRQRMGALIIEAIDVAMEASGKTEADMVSYDDAGGLKLNDAYLTVTFDKDGVVSSVSKSPMKGVHYKQKDTKVLKTVKRSKKGALRTLITCQD